MISRLISVVALVAAAGSVSMAQADESRCRSANDLYQSPAWGCGTATGFGTDTIIIRDCLFRVVSCRRVCEWAAGGPAVNQVVYHSGGQTSIRFNYWYFTASIPLIQGGTVEVVRNGAVIDRDRLY